MSLERLPPARRLSLLAFGALLSGLLTLALAGPPAGVRVSGTVVRLSGAPAGGVQVLVPGAEPEETTTDGDGRFQIRAEPGHYQIVARLVAGGGLSAFAEAGFEVTGSTPPPPLRLVVDPVADIRGVVVDETGAPRAGVGVHARLLGAAGPGSGLSTRTDGAGRFLFGGQLAGPWRITAYEGAAPRYRCGLRLLPAGVPAPREPGRTTGSTTTATEVRAGAGESRIVLGRTGRIEGRVRNAGGEPGPALVAVVAEPPDSGTGFPVVALGAARADGSFSFVCRPGRYRVASPGTCARTPATVVRAAGVTRADLTVPDGSLLVVCRNPDGTPRPGVPVDLRPPVGIPAPLWLTAPGHAAGPATDAGGSVRFAGLPAGEWTVVVRPAGAKATRATAEVAVEGRRDLTIVLERGPPDPR